MADATKSIVLRPPKAPNLPIAPVEYNQYYIDQLSNALRLYFNQLDNFAQSLTSRSGGNAIQMPYGGFKDLTTQTSTANTPKAITFNTTDYSNGVSMVAGQRITALVSGLYNLQFSVQVNNPSSQTDDVTIWIKVNGVDVPNSAGVVGTPFTHGSIDGHTVIGWNYLVPMLLNDYVELWWITTAGTTTLPTLPAFTVAPIHPAAASAIVTMSFVSAV